jgi:hypothetical protein
MANTRRIGPRTIRWTLSILTVSAFIVFAALATGGWWLEQRTLRGEIRFGENDESSVRVYGGAFSWWALRFEADSVWFRSPGTDARLGRFTADADLFAGLTTFMPAVAVKGDSAWLRLKSDTLPKKELQLDSLIFPEFSLPLAVSVRLQHLVVEDDSGLMARVESLRVRNRGAQRADAQARAVRARGLGDLTVAAWARADWSRRDSVDFSAGVRHGEDFATVKGRHAKSPLWKGRDALEAELAETAPYARALAGTKAAESLPHVRNVRLAATARLSDAPAFDLKLGGAVAAVRLSDAFTLSPQTVDLSAAYAGDRGALRLESRGPGGEDLLLEAEGRVLPGLRKWARAHGAGRNGPLDSIPLWTRLEYATVSVHGHARGFRVRVQDTVRTADLEIARADWNGRRVAVDVRTGDGSRLEAEARRAAPPSWNATFGLDVKPRERWVQIFVGDKVRFATLRVDGEVRDRTVRATLAARKIDAYGVTLDSLRSHHEYSPNGYVLKPSSLYDHKGGHKTVWTLEGMVTPVGAGMTVTARLSSARHGSLQYRLESSGMMEARARRFDVGALPYAYLDSLPFRDPVLDGTFAWNPKRKSGRADLSAQARFKKSDVEARVRGSWDSHTLNLNEASARMKGSEVGVAARLRLNGRQFWEAYEVKPAQYEYAAIRSPGLDIAAVLKVFQPEPALVKGSMSGELSYSVKSGFKGQLAFDAITPAEAVGDLILKDLDLAGNGDTLFVNARTTSQSVQPLNIRLRAAFSSLLGDEQRVRAEWVAGDSLRVRLDATTRRFQALRGTLAAQGKVALPEKSGSVDKIDLGIDFDIPLVDPVNRASLSARTFQGVYVLPGLSRQTFSLDPVLRGGVFRVSRFLIQNDQGQSVTGNFEYILARKALKAHVEGERFSAQWSDDYKVDLYGLNFDFGQDAEGLRVSGAFSTGSFLYVDAPLNARGTLKSVRFAYDQPALAKGPGSARQRRERAPATLNFSGSLSESLIRYRLKSFSDLQKVFRKERKKPATRPLRLNVQLQTLGNDNRIDSDMLRLTWVGDLKVRGTHPYTLFNGRVNALNGSLGLDKQAYDVARFEVKWLNAPMEEGRIHMESRKRLASDCSRRNESNVDSCTVITRLDGELNDMKFSYDSDCGGSYGAGASVAAILYSVQRGCYDNSLATGGGANYGNKALTLLEPTINRGLSTAFGRYTRNWIEAAEISGLGSLSGGEATTDSVGEALSLALTSKEYKRLRLKLRSGYHVAAQDLSHPWEHMAALEWRPPAEYITRRPVWRKRLNDNLRAVASVQTHSVKVNSTEQNEIEKKIGLVYSYVFWGRWWDKPLKREPSGK